jgi:hypothetical protein
MAPLRWANVQISLRVALVCCVTGEKADNIAQAISCPRAALDVWTEDSNPLDRAALCYLSNSLYEQAKHVGSEHEDFLATMQEIYRFLKRSLTVITLKLSPLVYLRSCQLRAFIIARLDRPEDALVSVS